MKGKPNVWTLWHGEDKIVGKGPLLPGQSVHVIERAAYDEVVGLLREAMDRYDEVYMQDGLIHSEVDWLQRAKKALDASSHKSP
jgi:hypothetical protein